MGAEIKDEYSALSISRQRKFYLRQRKRKRCTKCGRPVEEGSLCLDHLIQMREYRREKFGLKRRYKNAFSYRSADKVVAAPTNGEAHALPCQPPSATPHPGGDDLEMTLELSNELRDIKRHVDEVLTSLAPELESLPLNSYGFPPALLLKSWVLSNLYSIRSPRLFCEQLPYNLLWLWFLNLKFGKVNFQPVAFEQAYERLLRTDVARNFMAAVFSSHSVAVA